MADVEPLVLARHEATIERGLATFVEVGEALAAIRDDRLYRETHATFEDYCRDRWNLTPQHAGRLMVGAAVARQMEPIGSVTNEAQARELARVPESEREQVWRETLDRTGGKPTAAAVREVAAPQSARPVPTPESEPFDVEPAIERYPDLDAWRDQPDRVEALATALDGYGETERATRLDALAKSAAARREGRLPEAPAPHDDRADRLFDHVNSALRTAQTVSPEEFAELADPQHREMWRSQFIKATAVLSLYADVLSSAPALRSVR